MVNVGCAMGKRFGGGLGGEVLRDDRDLHVAGVEAGGDQGLVGRLVEVGAELTQSGFAEDPAHALL